MSVVIPEIGFEPVMRLQPCRGVADVHGNDLLVAYATSKGAGHAVRVDFLDVVAMLVTPSFAPSEAVRDFGDPGDGSLIAHADSSPFVEFAVGAGRGDWLGLDIADGVSQYSVVFDENLVLRVACRGVDVREFECGWQQDAVVTRDRLFEVAMALGPTVRELEADESEGG